MLNEQLRRISGRKTIAGIAVAIGSFAGLGTTAALWENPFFIRMTPAGGWEIALLLLMSLLLGVYVAVRRPRCSIKSASAGGVLGFIGIACPVCNKILLLLFGGELLLTRTAALAAKYKARTPPMQPCGDEGISVERVHEIAVQSCPEMLHAMRTFVEQAGGKLVIPPDTEIKLDDPELGVEQCQNTVKKLERAKSKAVGDYGGDARRLVDLVRASALFDFPTELANALDKFESAPATETDAPRLRIVRVKDRLDNPDAGYRDLMLNVAFHANGECVHIGELQLHLRPVFVLKKVAHVSYEISRDGVIELD